MENKILATWQEREYTFRQKDIQWYWVVAIVAVGAAVAAFILSDYLFSFIAVAGGFTVMLVGSKKPAKHQYTLSEKGFSIGTHLVPYSQMTSFAIKEDEPRKLSIATKNITGTVSAPLGDTDHRIIRTELKNRNIEEVESLDTFIDGLAKGIGL